MNPTGDDGWLSEQGRAVKQRVKVLTDDLAGEAPTKASSRASSTTSMAAVEPLAALVTRRPGLVDAAATALSGPSWGRTVSQTTLR